MPSARSHALYDVCLRRGREHDVVSLMADLDLAGLPIIRGVSECQGVYRSQLSCSEQVALR